MRTAIFIIKNNTALTIETSEAVLLEQLGREDAPVKLKEGTNKVTVNAGVFRVLSTRAVRVSADADDLHVMSTPNKDGDWPDLTKGVGSINGQTLRGFFIAKNHAAPQ